MPKPDFDIELDLKRLNHEFRQHSPEQRIIELYKWSIEVSSER